MTDPFVIEDVEEFARKHGYGTNTPLTNQRFGYTLSPDLKQGFKQAVRNNQATLALEYLVVMFDIVEDFMSKMNTPEVPFEKVMDAAVASGRRKTTKSDSPQTEEDAQVVDTTA